MVCMPVMGYFLIMKPRRGETFVSRKITRGLSRINVGLEKCIYLGNLDLRGLGPCKRLCRNAMVNASTKKSC